MPRVKTTVLASIPTLDPLYVGAILRRACQANTELVLEIRDIYARPELFEYNSDPAGAWRSSRSRCSSATWTGSSS